MPKNINSGPENHNKSNFINIALIGGQDLCIEILNKAVFETGQGELKGRITAVADPDPQAPGMILAKKLGIRTVTDFYRLFNPKCDINWIVILIPDEKIRREVIRVSPPHIRKISWDVFNLFWNAIQIEEKKLRKRNEEVEMILNGIQDFIIVIDPQMNIMEVNQPFLENMNYSRDEVIGRKCHEVFQKTNPQCTRDVECPLDEVIRNRRSSQRVVPRVNRNGELRYTEVTIYPVWENPDKISKFIEVSRDITERIQEEDKITRRLEQMVEERTRQLEETHEKLLHQDKMASLGKLSASVVHEINNPIAGMLNMVLLIKRIKELENVTFKNQERFEQYLDLMETECRRISRIVSNLLSFSRQRKIELNPLDINQLLEKTLLLNSNLLKISNVRVKKEFDPGLPQIVGSQDQLLQVFMNIISNAIEAMEGKNNATLTIETRHCPEKNSVVVDFKDEGVGIPPENQSQLFEPFFTTKKKGRGVGLGLSVAFGIIKDHNGEMKVESTVGEGAVFSVKIPVKPGEDNYVIASEEDKSGIEVSR